MLPTPRLLWNLFKDIPWKARMVVALVMIYHGLSSLFRSRGVVKINVPHRGTVKVEIAQDEAEPTPEELSRREWGQAKGVKPLFVDFRSYGQPSFTVKPTGSDRLLLGRIVHRLLIFDHLAQATAVIFILTISATSKSHLINSLSTPANEYLSH
jgi:hypothetical protein